MGLEVNVRKDNERGIYVYYLNHDGAEIPIVERKFGNVDKRRAAAAEAQTSPSEPSGELE